MHEGLAPAIENALELGQARCHRRAAEEELRQPGEVPPGRQVLPELRHCGGDCLKPGKHQRHGRQHLARQGLEASAPQRRGLAETSQAAAACPPRLAPLANGQPPPGHTPPGPLGPGLLSAVLKRSWNHSAGRGRPPLLEEAAGARQPAQKASRAAGVRPCGLMASKRLGLGGGSGAQLRKAPSYQAADLRDKP